MTAQYRIGAVIPAAGLSSRMGAFKPLLPYAEATVIESAVGSVTPYADTAVAVLGLRADELRGVLARRFGCRLTIAYNPDYASTDMLASVKIGLRAMGECDAFFLLPADMPAVPAAVFETLIAGFDGSAGVIYPVIGGRRGHPPLISAALIPEILAYKGGGGLRAILGSSRTKEIPVSDAGILLDLDTPQDYTCAMPTCCLSPRDDESRTSYSPDRRQK